MLSENVLSDMYAQRKRTFRHVGSAKTYLQTCTLSENVSSDMYAQQKFRSARSFAGFAKNLSLGAVCIAKATKLFHVDNED